MRVAIAVLAALSLIALATLTPGEPLVSTPTNCLICGDRGVADALLNLMLFVPLGAALAFGGVRASRILLAGLAVSMTVELLQMVIPGRDPSAGDLVFNTAGAFAGAATPFLFAKWQGVPAWRTVWWAAAWAVIAAVVVIITAALLRPAFPERLYYGQWTPEFDNTEEYLGRVASATVGELKVRDGPVAESAELRQALLRGETLELRAVAGPMPQRNSPVFNIYDDTQHEVLSIMAEDRDVVIRYRMGSSGFKLDQPVFVIRDALANVHPNEAWQLRFRLVDGGICAESGGVVSCPLGFSIARGWSVFLHTLFPRGVETALDMFWLMLLFIPAGSFITDKRAALVAVVACIAGLLTANAVTALLPIRWYEVLVGLAGLPIGAAIRRLRPSFLPGA